MHRSVAGTMCPYHARKFEIYTKSRQALMCPL
nr:MAG TPA: hypothetical protein [Caudoviricetes sp.]